MDYNQVLAEPHWLCDWRQIAWSRAHFPANLRKLESWRHTPVNAIRQLLTTKPQILLQDNVAPATDVAKILEKIASYALDAHKILLVNNQVLVVQDTDTLPTSCTVLSMRSALHTSATLAAIMQNSCRIAQRSGDAQYQTDDLLCYWQQATWDNGIYLELAADAVLTRPLAIFYVHDMTANNTLALENIYYFNAGSKAEIIECYIDADTAQVIPKINLISTRVILQANAQCTHNLLTDLTAHYYHHHSVKSEQYHHSKYQLHNLPLTTAWLRQTITCDLLANNATAAVHGALVARGTEHISNIIEINHHALDCSSHTDVRGIAVDKASMNFLGKIFVAPGANGTAAYLYNKNLLLANTAALNTKPQLKIYADAVQCVHSANIGQLDPQQLFYLQTRGFSLAAAKQYLMQAFLYALMPDALPIMQQGLATVLEV